MAIIVARGSITIAKVHTNGTLNQHALSGGILMAKQ